MDRRQALRNLGLGAGAMVATPTVIGLLQSCKSEPKDTYVLQFLSEGEFHALTQMVDLIIPSDEAIPGALDVGVHKFIDAFWANVTPKTQGEVWEERYEPIQENIKSFFKMFTDEFRNKFKKELGDGEPEEFDEMLATYLKIPKEEQIEIDISMEDFYEAFAADATTQPDKEAAIFSLIAGIRSMTIWAWKTSEQIGKNVLWYDPIPGKQLGCIPLDEAGNGNDMAL
ncbi:MAG: gluconate 2-dehydrogenase subunit 3 family protein [Bacteroidia bacterium]|nr:gluconate 2-dehydrogenase subunit 3 family protein [Bacteroidia bacterium]NNF30648.1 gluconate 2-dehydrogenase subunit 3 family protein [Flavobacteriaceae bacterium]MBT8274872.1 gluconate 2-dehydrogenase subunit 3 family protein [Bacteroidia bacterium]NNJ80691.1 gluconate 2-dehydrogenase subunit 3 family protein [Flavobacteriaceae bacterium]NNK54907.1 gluconate 2-dehydrogenase subunit 3 family protein [Flavobacteriaceae bacterium]